MVRHSKEFITDLLCIYSTDVDAVLDDISAKEPLITPSRLDQVRKLIISIQTHRLFHIIGGILMQEVTSDQNPNSPLKFKGPPGEFRF